ncbi:MAG: hypothetical protein WBH85_06175 [Thermoanaerobaculia bacterium]
MSFTRPTVAVALVILAVGCVTKTAEPEITMDQLAESYVKLVLAVGQHDQDYVDAYFGPEVWKTEAQEAAISLSEIGEHGRRTLDDLGALAPSAGVDEMEALRHRHLTRSLESLNARVDLLSGRTMTFDEESRALYDAVAPSHDDAHFEQILGRLDELLPGEGPLIERYETFKRDFIIPPDRLDAVFSAAIEACRERTLTRLELPADESFTVEYVTDKNWSGYNWYQGNYRSLIQVNTDLPIYIDRALDLACHEGYPGHHVYSIVVERDLFRQRGWVEFSVYPLFSPRSLIAEGTANFGIEVAFPGDERLELERQVLFPLAGLEPDRAAEFAKVQEAVKKLGYAGNEAARRYLDGEIGPPEAAAWLSRYAMMPPDRAKQRVGFIDQYRSYVINYNLGQDLVRQYVEAQGGTAEDPDRRWREFGALLASPRLPSGLDN